VKLLALFALEGIAIAVGALSGLVITGARFLRLF
jgi:hypothetical protein